jgi:hypothetical protein
MRHMGIGGTAPSFLTSELHGGEWSASRLCHFTPGDMAGDTHWVRSWVSPRAGVDATEDRK